MRVFILPYPLAFAGLNASRIANIRQQSRRKAIVAPRGPGPSLGGVGGGGGGGETALARQPVLPTANHRLFTGSRPRANAALLGLLAAVEKKNQLICESNRRYHKELITGASRIRLSDPLFSPWRSQINA